MKYKYNVKFVCIVNVGMLPEQIIKNDSLVGAFGLAWRAMHLTPATMLMINMGNFNTSNPVTDTLGTVSINNPVNQSILFRQRWHRDRSHGLNKSH